MKELVRQRKQRKRGGGDLGGIGRRQSNHEVSTFVHCIYLYIVLYIVLYIIAYLTRDREIKVKL